MEDICADSTSAGPSELLKMVLMLMARTKANMSADTNAAAWCRIMVRKQLGIFLPVVVM